MALFRIMRHHWPCCCHCAWEEQAIMIHDPWASMATTLQSAGSIRGDWLSCSRRPEPHPASSGALWSCLVLLLTRFACFVPFVWLPPSRTPPSSQFHLPSRAGMASYTHGAGAHVSDTQNFDVCVQSNTILFRTGPITKTTKHSKVHSLIMAGKSLDSHSIPARWPLSNQSPPKSLLYYSMYDYFKLVVYI